MPPKLSYDTKSNSFIRYVGYGDANIDRRRYIVYLGAFSCPKMFPRKLLNNFERDREMTQFVLFPFHLFFYIFATKIEIICP